MRTRPRLKLIPLFAALALLVGLALETYSRPRPSEAEPYHARVRAAAAELPAQIGPWEGKRVKPTRAARELLNPNVIYQRLYTNANNGQQVSVLIVHCKDARDIAGHYPPVCYPAHGWEQRSAERFEGEVAGQELHGTQYRFARSAFGSGSMIVHNLIVMPGRIVPDMDQVEKLAGSYVRRFYGAAQVQVVFQGADMTPRERERIFRTMVRAHMPVIEAIRDGEIDHE